MTDENHDVLIKLGEKVDQIEKREAARGQREYVIVAGIILALVNAFLTRFGEGSAVDSVAGLVRLFA